MQINYLLYLLNTLINMNHKSFVILKTKQVLNFYLHKRVHNKSNFTEKNTQK